NRWKNWPVFPANGNSLLKSNRPEELTTVFPQPPLATSKEFPMVPQWLCNKTAMLAFALVTLLPNVVRADTLQGQPIYAQNNTDRPIWVASQYVPPGSTSYVTDGWWQVDPGERVLIHYNNG